MRSFGIPQSGTQFSPALLQHASCFSKDLCPLLPVAQSRSETSRAGINIAIRTLEHSINATQHLCHSGYL